MSELSVNSESQLTTEVNTSETVNSKPTCCSEVNIKLSQQMRQILLFLFRYVNRVFQQVEIMGALYGEITDSRAVSFSRTIKTLIKAGLIDSRKAYYSGQFSCWFPQRVQYFLTEKGEQFVKENLRDSGGPLQRTRKEKKAPSDEKRGAGQG